MRLPDGLDYSKITEEEPSFQATTELNLNQIPIGCENLSASMMHADSNLNISHLGVIENVVPPVPTLSKYTYAFICFINKSHFVIILLNVYIFNHIFPHFIF